MTSSVSGENSGRDFENRQDSLRLVIPLRFPADRLHAHAPGNCDLPWNLMATQHTSVISQSLRRNGVLVRESMQASRWPNERAAVGQLRESG